MARVPCLDCGIPVVVDPTGRCPEGHVVGVDADPEVTPVGRRADRPGPSAPAEPVDAETLLNELHELYGDDASDAPAGRDDATTVLAARDTHDDDLDARDEGLEAAAISELSSLEAAATAPTDRIESVATDSGPPPLPADAGELPSVDHATTIDLTSFTARGARVSGSGEKPRRRSRFRR